MSLDLPPLDDAACVGLDTDIFFPEQGGTHTDAKRICRGCNARPECLEYALAHGERYGIWGGTTEDERRRIARKRGIPLPPAYGSPTYLVAQRRAEVRTLHGQGLTRALIAERLDVTPELITQDLLHLTKQDRTADTA